MSPFEKHVAKSYAYNEQVFSASNRWYTLNSLYFWNYWLTRCSKEERKPHIPKIIHQIWLGGEMPEQYKIYAETWKNHHLDWQYKLWTDKDADDIFITRRNLFDKATNVGMKSDILRYEILKQYGGVYVDTDFECLKPLNDLMHLDFFTGVGYDTEAQLYIGLIASVPNHPIIRHTIDSLGPIYTGNRGSAIMNITGANTFTTAFFDTVDVNAEKVVAFPTPYFYPYPNNVRGTGDPHSYVTKETYAIHHWAVSWLKKR
jgi:inositol phosphorylceramide mannosyltransferase catalytic subunit